MKELIRNPNFLIIAKMDSISKSGNLPFLKDQIYVNFLKRMVSMPLRLVVVILKNIIKIFFTF